MTTQTLKECNGILGNTLTESSDICAVNLSNAATAYADMNGKAPSTVVIEQAQSGLDLKLHKVVALDWSAADFSQGGIQGELSGSYGPITLKPGFDSLDIGYSPNLTSLTFDSTNVPNSLNCSNTNGGGGALTSIVIPDGTVFEGSNPPSDWNLQNQSIAHDSITALLNWLIAQRTAGVDLSSLSLMLNGGANAVLDSDQLALVAQLPAGSVAHN